MTEEYCITSKGIVDLLQGRPAKLYHRFEGGHWNEEGEVKIDDD